MVFMSILPEPPWSSARDRHRRAPLTREAITEAALRVVDAEGLDALSMRRLATELDCQASALYSHVSGKAELLELALDRAVAEIKLAPVDLYAWQDQLKDIARGIRDTLLAHNDLAKAGFGWVPTGPNALVVADRMLALLLAGGLSPEAAGHAVDVITEYAIAKAYEGSFWLRRHREQPEYVEQLMTYYRALPADRYPVLTQMVEAVFQPDEEPDARFEFGLDVTIRGLTALAGAKPGDRPSRRP